MRSVFTPARRDLIARTVDSVANGATVNAP
jgi:hypothetical protein